MRAVLIVALLAMAGCDQHPVGGPEVFRACGTSWAWVDGAGRTWVGRVDYALTPIARGANLDEICGTSS